MSIKLLSYQIQEKIYQGERTLIYRGIRRSDSLRVAIDFLRNKDPDFNELLHFYDR
ncbi:hypothetical protein PMG71_12510 [Roseofilum sp. BLCC_M154]|uniref:Uncharacterized protein n=1 Tax=Roseofilum acuticapitatum BLCC-M154 TaxID=3022444 RepID=A0ABT7ATL1_9CYAN|nr:hypothetical protein [Roseofilum acuticapitatum]MDJ1170253.1 hypothetical protein [Roseofilum acuticapitatum BLCC-M154]